MDPINDELLSAYLDGELPADERARVDRLLAASPESRALLEDLRAVRGGVQALPRHRLEEDLAPRVLERALRVMLAGDGDPSSGSPQQTPAGDGRADPRDAAADDRNTSDGEAAGSPAGGIRRGSRLFRSGHRPFVWAGLAVAAGVVLMLLTPNQVAKGPAEQVAQAPARRPAEGRAGSGGAAGATAEFRADRERAGRAAGDDRQGKAAGEGALPKVPEESSRGSTLGREAAGSRMLKGGQPPGLEAARDAATSDPSAQPMPSPAGAEPDAASLAEGPSEPSAPTLGDDPALAADAYQVADLSGEDVLVVVCKVPSSDAYRGAFEDVLQHNDINLEPPLAREKLTEQLAGTEAEEKLEAGVVLSQQVQQRRLAVEALDRTAGKSPVARAEKTARRLNRKESQAQASQADDLIFVEATAEQLEAVLENMAGSETFGDLQVDPAPAVPRQQEWAAYGRSRAGDKPRSKLSLPADDLDAKAGGASRATRPKTPRAPKDDSAVREAEVAPELDWLKLRSRAQRVELAPLEAAERADNEADNEADQDPAQAVKRGRAVKPGQAVKRGRGVEQQTRSDTQAGADEALPAGAGDSLYRAVFVFQEIPAATAEPAEEQPAAQERP